MIKVLTTHDSQSPRFPHNPFNPKNLSSIYSVLNDFTGFINAAFIER